jgi:hypothetical protein
MPSLPVIVIRQENQFRKPENILSAPIRNYGDVLGVISFSAARRTQRAIIFLFAVERPRYIGMTDLNL